MGVLAPGESGAPGAPLQRNGLVTRTVYPQVPPRVEPTLTDLGTPLLSTVLALAARSADHLAEIRRNQRGFDTGPPGAG